MGIKMRVGAWVRYSLSIQTDFICSILSKMCMYQNSGKTLWYENGIINL